MVGVVLRAWFRAVVILSAMGVGSVGVLVLVEGNFPRGMLWEPGSGRSWEGIVVVVVIFARI